MKKLWKWLFFRNDWYTVWSSNAIWNMTDKKTGQKSQKIAVYEIQYSKLRKDYRLYCSGLTPKEHSYYGDVVKYFMIKYKSRVHEWKVFNARKHELNYN